VARAASDLFGFSRLWIWRVDSSRRRLSTLIALGVQPPLADLQLEPGLLSTVCADRVPRPQVEVSRESVGVGLDLPPGERVAGAVLPLLSGGELEGLFLGVWGPSGTPPASPSALLTLAAIAAMLLRLDRVARERQKLYARSDALARQLHAGVAVITRQYELLYANDRFWQILGLVPPEVPGFSLGCLFSDPGERARVERFIEGAWTSSGERALNGFSLPQPSGDSVLVNLCAHPLPLEEEPALQLVLSEVQSERREEKSDDRLKAFGLYLAGLANDLKGPLTAYLGHLKLLGDRKDLPDGLREAFRFYRTVTSELLSRISRTMEWGRRFPVMVPVDLGGVVKAAAAAIEWSDLPDKVQLSVEAGAMPPISGMADQLQVAIEQLLQNACEALVDRGGTIRLACLEQGETVSVSVSDDGEGIPASILPYVFDPFASTKGGSEGRGIGLAIVKEIVGRHEGSVEIRSEPGRGTTVVLTFPRLTQAGALAGRPADRLTVLLVDDDEGLQEAYRLMLERAGYRVVIAMDADEALRQIAVEAPDVILIDVQLPGRDGVTLAEALRKWHPEYLERAVLHTAYAYEARVQETARRCGLTLLEKPCDPKLLFETLARLARPERS
jgi:signal transduction histidine kinase/CheY-like chemotaxis protein